MADSANTSALSAARGLWTSIAQKKTVKTHGTLMFFILLIVVSAVFTPNFLSMDNLTNTLIRAEMELDDVIANVDTSVAAGRQQFDPRAPPTVGVF